MTFAARAVGERLKSSGREMSIQGELQTILFQERSQKSISLLLTSLVYKGLVQKLKFFARFLIQYIQRSLLGIINEAY